MPARHFDHPITTPLADPVPPKQGHPEIGETLAHNASMLANIEPVLENDSVVAKEYDDQRVFATPVVLYVDRSTGSIEGLGSHEKIARTRSQAVAGAEPGAIEALATGLPQVMIDDPNTVRVYAWFERALLTAKTEKPDVYTIQRPASWVRNDRVRLSQRSLSHHPLEKSIPEGIERGIFLKSIDEHNQEAESDVYIMEKH